MSSQPTTLEITQNQGHFRYRLKQPITDRFSMPAESMWNVEVDSTAIDSLSKMIANAVKDATTALRNAPDVAAMQHALKTLDTQLIKAGTGLYREMFPLSEPTLANLHQALRQLKGPLLIATDTPNVNWELLFAEEATRVPSDEYNFFGLVNDIGRRLIMCNVPPGIPRREGAMRCLMIANPNAGDPNWDLPHSESEAQKLGSWLNDHKVSCDFLSGLEATQGAVQTKLFENEYELIHFAGHVERDQNAKEYALKLHDGLLLAKTIRKHVRGTPIVFINGCRSGDAIAGLTDAFLRANAQAVVGSA